MGEEFFGRLARRELRFAGVAAESLSDPRDVVAHVALGKFHIAVPYRVDQLAGRYDLSQALNEKIESENSRSAISPAGRDGQRVRSAERE